MVAHTDNKVEVQQWTINNALDAIIRLDPAEKEQTHYLTEQSTTDTPQSRQRGFIGQSVQWMDELKYAVVDGVVGEYGKGTVRHVKLQCYIHSRNQRHTIATWNCQATTTTNKGVKHNS